MKLIHLPVLCLVLAGAAEAADLSPNEMGALLQKPLPYAVYRLGLDYTQSDTEAEQRIIQRRFHLAIGLPAQWEFGFALLDTQEPAVDHRSKPLGAQTWLRWNLVQRSWISTAATLQYQPGLATRESAFQASQDRTSFGLDLNLTPFSWMSSAVHAQYSRRQDERFQNLLLGAETVAGARLSFGTANFGLYGDALQRQLEAKNIETGSSRKLFAREWQAGLYFASESIQVKAFASIPDTQRYFGMTERGYGASFSMTIGSSKQESQGPVDPRDQPGDALQAIGKEERADELKRKAQASTSTEVKVLETNELDEFQMLEKKAQDVSKAQQETPAEKAERELRKSLEEEKKMAAQKVIDEEKAKREAAEAYQQRVQDDENAYNEYKDEVNEEVNRYALPDAEDLNWNGLTP